MSPGIDFAESIPPAHVAWPARTTNTVGLWYRPSIIYLPRILCLCVCVCVCVTICCGTLCYSFNFINQTDQGDEGERLEREGLRWRDRKGTDRRGRVRKDFSLFKPNLISMDVHSATCRCSVELFKQWYTLADFLPNWNFRGLFSTYH
jgi:hypothetical protein